MYAGHGPVDSMLQQAFFAINQPARTSILPKLLPSEQLPAANALSMTVVSAGAIAGPMVGGALIPVLGYAGLYLIDTVLLFATLYAAIRTDMLDAPYMRDFLLTAKDTSFSTLDGVSAVR